MNPSTYVDIQSGEFTPYLSSNPEEKKAHARTDVPVETDEVKKRVKMEALATKKMASVENFYRNITGLPDAKFKTMRAKEDPLYVFDEETKRVTYDGKLVEPNKDLWFAAYNAYVHTCAKCQRVYFLPVGNKQPQKGQCFCFSKFTFTMWHFQPPNP